MDQHVKQMLKLIEEDADSFAKKAEMYYQKRPELISLVEEFYRMYRSLAERYDHVDVELQKNIPSDLQSQCSGISDVGSEPSSSLPSPDRRPSRAKSGGRAAGFDFFLGNVGNGSDLYNKEGDESSTLDSESESDDSSVQNYSGIMQSNDDEHGLRLKIIQLEDELREVKEKLHCVQEKITFEKCSDENCEGPHKITNYEEKLQAAREKIRLSEDEISRLTIQLEKFQSLGKTYNLVSEGAVKLNNFSDVLESNTTSEQNQVNELGKIINVSDAEVIDSQYKIQTHKEELKITQKLRKLEEEVASKDFIIQNLQDQLKLAQKELSVEKNKLEREQQEVSKLQDRVARHTTNLSNRDQEIGLSEENEQLQVEITRITKERSYLEDNLDFCSQSLEEDVARKEEMEGILVGQVKHLKGVITEKDKCMEELKGNLDALQLKYDMLMAEKEDLSTNIAALAMEVSSKDDHIDEMSKHLHQLHMEHVDLIARAERTRKLAEELYSRIKKLEREIDKKEEIILQGAEEKREAIKQLCFSLEHYRNGYHRLRQAVIGHKGLRVMAS